MRPEGDLWFLHEHWRYPVRGSIQCRIWAHMLQAPLSSTIPTLAKHCNSVAAIQLVACFVVQPHIISFAYDNFCELGDASVASTSLRLTTHKLGKRLQLSLGTLLKEFCKRYFQRRNMYEITIQHIRHWPADWSKKFWISSQTVSDHICHWQSLGYHLAVAGADAGVWFKPSLQRKQLCPWHHHIYIYIYIWGGNGVGLRSHLIGKRHD